MSGEIVQQLRKSLWCSCRGLSVCVFVFKSSTHMVAYCHLLFQFQSIWCPLLVSVGTRYACGTQTDMRAKNTHPYSKERKKCLKDSNSCQFNIGLAALTDTTRHDENNKRRDIRSLNERCGNSDMRTIATSPSCPDS